MLQGYCIIAVITLILQNLIVQVFLVVILLCVFLFFFGHKYIC